MATDKHATMDNHATVTIVFFVVCPKATIGAAGLIRGSVFFVVCSWAI
jgi:hypothetical protein